MTSQVATGGFVGWIMQYGQIVAFFAQLLYWLVLGVAAVWATLLFKRLVDFRTGAMTGGEPETKEPVKVEEFTD